MTGLVFKVVIPARFASTRLPGKPLLDLGGKPMVVRRSEHAAELAIERTDGDALADGDRGQRRELAVPAHRVAEPQRGQKRLTSCHVARPTAVNAACSPTAGNPSITVRSAVSSSSAWTRVANHGRPPMRPRR